MKAISVILIMVFLMATPRAYAVDKVAKNSDSTKSAVAKQEQDKERKQYQNFIDANKNGIDDKLEKSRKTATNIQPKPEQESIKLTPKNTEDNINPKSDIEKPENKPAVPVKTEKEKSEKK